MNAIGGMAVGQRGEGLGQPVVGIDTVQLAVFATARKLHLLVKRWRLS